MFNIACTFIAEALGQEGFQLFINAGQEVDEQLVNALIKEVLQEKMQTAVGQRTTRDDEGMVGYRGKKKSERAATVTPHPAAASASDRVVASSPRATTQVKRADSPPVVSLSWQFPGYFHL